jgi:hypothetical protein
MALSPQANYTNWETAACRRNLVPTFVDRGVSRGQRCGSPTVVNHSFLDRELSSHDWKIKTAHLLTMSCHFEILSSFTTYLMTLVPAYVASNGSVHCIIAVLVGICLGGDTQNPRHQMSPPQFKVATSRLSSMESCLRFQFNLGIRTWQPNQACHFCVKDTAMFCYILLS